MYIRLTKWYSMIIDNTSFQSRDLHGRVTNVDDCRILHTMFAYQSYCVTRENYQIYTKYLINIIIHVFYSLSSLIISLGGKNQLSEEWTDGEKRSLTMRVE